MALGVVLWCNVVRCGVVEWGSWRVCIFHNQKMHFYLIYHYYFFNVALLLITFSEGESTIGTNQVHLSHIQWLRLNDTRMGISLWRIEEECSRSFSSSITQPRSARDSISRPCALERLFLVHFSGFFSALVKWLSGQTCFGRRWLAAAATVHSRLP